MNMITIMIVALVLCAYFYPSCPKILKDNKQMLLGVLMGLLMGQYLGLKVEGMEKGEQKRRGGVRRNVGNKVSNTQCKKAPGEMNSCPIYGPPDVDCSDINRLNENGKPIYPFCYREWCYENNRRAAPAKLPIDKDNKVWWVDDKGCGVDQWNK